MTSDNCKPTEHNEIQDLPESDLDNATGGWGALVGLANSLASAGKASDKGADLSKDTLIGLLIG